MIIAEIGQAHEGSLGIAHSYIDALSETGIDAIKFQMHFADYESSLHENFRVNFSYEDKTRFDYWKRMEFSTEQWKQLKKHCEDKKLEFICSPFSLFAINCLEKLKVKRYKISSGDVSNFLMIKKIAETKKPIIFSSGMSSFKELTKTINFIKPYKTPISILQCSSKYPTNPSQWGLNVIHELKEKFNLPVGYSDHSGNIYASLAATTLGAEIIEFHAVFDKKIFGPDASSSIPINEIKKLTAGIKQIKQSLQNPIDKNNTLKYFELKNMFEKSICINTNMKKGEIITIEKLESKKPSNMGVLAKNYNTILGKRINKNMQKWDFIKIEDLI